MMTKLPASPVPSPAKAWGERSPSGRLGLPEPQASLKEAAQAEEPQVGGLGRRLEGVGVRRRRRLRTGGKRRPSARPTAARPSPARSQDFLIAAVADGAGEGAVSPPQQQEAAVGRKPLALVAAPPAAAPHAAAEIEATPAQIEAICCDVASTRSPGSPVAEAAAAPVAAEPDVAATAPSLPLPAAAPQQLQQLQAPAAPSRAASFRRSMSRKLSRG